MTSLDASAKLIIDRWERAHEGLPVIKSSLWVCVKRSLLLDLRRRWY
jgi:hypothetical protein